jgi:hypothetical protein
MAQLGPPVRVLADLVRLITLASAASASALFGTEGVIRFTLVFLASLVPRLIGRIPAPFDLLYSTALLLAAWSMTAKWYQVIPWIDWPVHAVTTGAIAAMLYLMLARFGLLPGLRVSPLRRHSTSVVLLIVALGFAAGSVWELYEWLANHLLAAGILVGYDDTIADLLMDGAGSLLAGLALVAWSHREQRIGSGSATGAPAGAADRAGGNQRPG